MLIFVAATAVFLIGLVAAVVVLVVVLRGRRDGPGRTTPPSPPDGEVR